MHKTVAIISELALSVEWTATRKPLHTINNTTYEPTIVEKMIRRIEMISRSSPDEHNVNLELEPPGHQIGDEVLKYLIHHQYSNTFAIKRLVSRVYSALN
jgi:hypothetical protein